MTHFIDTNVSIGRWPFRQLPGGETTELLATLKSQGVEQAWTGSFEGLFHRDLAGVNARLADACAAHGQAVLLPFGSINPKLPDWEEDLRRCHEVHKMRGIRLHANYHGYTLADPLLAQLLAAAERRDLVVQLVVSMEDERTQNPQLRVPHVDCAPLVGLVKERPKLRLVVLNAFRALTPAKAADVAIAGSVCFDIAMLEGVGGVEHLVQQVGPDHVVFGSHAPLFYPHSAVLKLRESELAGAQIEAIASGNARRLLAQ